jgi:CRP-like cAMP-binding protein
MRLDKATMVRALHDEPKFSELFISHLLARNVRVEADLVDQLFNSSEKRLARLLLLMANFGKEGRAELAVTTSAEAMSPAPLHEPDGMITQVRQACGAGMKWNNALGRCATTSARRHVRRGVVTGH